MFSVPMVIFSCPSFPRLSAFPDILSEFPDGYNLRVFNVFVLAPKVLSERLDSVAAPMHCRGEKTQGIRVFADGFPMARALLRALTCQWTGL
jgi:hypothetical protein